MYLSKADKVFKLHEENTLQHSVLTTLASGNVVELLHLWQSDLVSAKVQ